MFENSISLKNSQTLEHKFKGLKDYLFAKNFITDIFQTRSLTSYNLSPYDSTDNYYHAYFTAQVFNLPSCEKNY